ncbi:DUF4338 domain-containing protein [Desulfofundulus sp. TPOSR]|uniref:Druantia anti-phage system protein DruA n=1 Tax=Desulfofundulus sp. TPOSR TaxID=2714340 RepID=UPI001409B41F|nr:Druantia anti-phage system protein DruA [Desulfofundulus sp. TPOSR]NHM28912.1 DUF4338 domain-containing protein [Desulfofundulus sp. TPOSR]
MSISAKELHRLVLEKLESVGFDIDQDGYLTYCGDTKDALRQLHEPARLLELARRQEWLAKNLPRFINFFADGVEVVPEKISPVLVEVKNRKQHALFRIARLLWSLPFSKGYGRRLRFLVFDNNNDKLIGILALQSPPLSFPPRDRLFRYPEGKKVELVNQTMDIQTLGAVPPYNYLLGGKLVAMAAASNEIREAYRLKYGDRMTEMEKRLLPAHLVALTTTSAFGRSSLYNRLRYKSLHIAYSLGYTDGYGSFHLMELYPLFKEFLESQGISTRGGFGVGPRIKWQIMVRALERLGFSSDLLRHNVKREAFLFPLVDNLTDYMEGRTTEPVYRDLPFSDLADWWRMRWLLPRVERTKEWLGWRKSDLYNKLIINTLEFADKQEIASPRAVQKDGHLLSDCLCQQQPVV